MKRAALLFFLGVLSFADAHAQRARLARLEATLAEQRKDDAAKAHTLAELATTCATIDPERAFTISREAVALAEKLHDDRSLAEAWVSQRWAYYYLGQYGTCDSVNRLAAAAADRSGDARSWALVHGTPHWISTMSDSTAHSWLQRSLIIADSLGDRALAANILYWYGIHTYAATTATMLEEAMARFTAIGDSSGLGMCLLSLELFEPYASDRAGKQRNLEHAARLFDQDGNVIWALWAHGGLSQAAGLQADYTTAIAEGLKTLDAARTAGLEHEVCFALDALSLLYRSMGDLRNALTAELSALGYASEIDERLAIMNQVGRLYGLLGRPDSAIFQLQRSMQTLRDWTDQHPTYGAWRYHEAEGFLAEVLASQGRISEAVPLYRSALQEHRRKSTHFAEETWVSLGYAHTLLSLPPEELRVIGYTLEEARSEALQLLQRALALAAEQSMLKEQADALQELAALFEAQGRVGEAFEYHKRYTAMKDSVLDQDKAKAVATLQIQYETEKKEQQIVLLGKDKEVQAKEIQKQKLVRNGFIGGFAFVGLFALVFFVQRNRISKARKRSEELLLNILPEEVADELKEKGHADARHFDTATILFTDFKGFTQLSEQVSPADLVAELNTCFKAFDGIMERYRIEKIKTIGDAYMAAGGLPDPQHGSPADVVCAALEMQEFMKLHKSEREAQGKPFFEMRVGIHTGPVVAGIVGVKKFQYDIWGDTVNTASRMESSGEVGMVNISEATYALVKSEPGLTFTPRGKVQAKGKGEMEMYYVGRSLGEA